MSTRGERAALAASRWIDTESDHEREIADELRDLLCDFSAAEVERERTALQSGEGWEPIETAPKDGTPFLAHWQNEFGRWFGVILHDEDGWFLMDRSEPFSEANRLQHWQPIFPPQE